YYAMCTWFDETCGSLLELIDEKGIRENTLVIYVTDNGWIQHPEKNGYAPRSKQTPYEGGIRTPIMFRWPGQFKASHRSELVSSIDLYPTILSAAGLPLPNGLPGLDLVESMRGSLPLARKQLFGEGFAHDIADINKPEASLLYRWT
ncbi:MAG: sulfatase-like hydrolase/transferase, partial [Verrucomicrobiota bacterium]